MIQLNDDYQGERIYRIDDDRQAESYSDRPVFMRTTEVAYGQWLEFFHTEEPTTENLADIAIKVEYYDGKIVLILFADGKQKADEGEGGEPSVIMHLWEAP